LNSDGNAARESNSRANKTAFEIFALRCYNSAVDQRLALADEFLADAQDLLERGRLRSALPRAYYAVYHLCVLLFEKHSLKPSNFPGASGRPAQMWEHRIIRTEFFHQFVVKRPLFVWARGVLLRRLYDDRIRADYRPEAEFTDTYVRGLVKDTKQLVDEIRKVVIE
jgi:uncharacterized protein (UPF0332 family)